MDQNISELPLVCFLSTSLNYGGAETVVIKLATELKRRGWRIKIISMIVPTISIEKLQADGIEVASLNMRRGVPDPRALFKLAKLLRRWRPQVLHSHMVHANLLGRLVRLIVRIPVQISTAHNINEGPRWLEIAYRITDSLTDVTTNVSQAAVGRYIRVGAARPSKIRFIPNGLDTEVFCPDDNTRIALRNELELGDAFVWLAVGRLTQAKDYPNMLQAFSQLPLENQTLLLIAGRGELKENLARKIIDLGMEHRIRLLGVRRDVLQLMNAADAYIMSSAWEGFPMVLLEAASTGLPIVATDVGGNREIVREPTSGIIVAPHNSELLGNAMQQVMTMSEKARITMGKTGREYVESNFNHRLVVNMWEKLYWEFLNQKKDVV